MKLNGKLDYLELPATGGTLDSVKSFYSAAFSWSFTDYGPTYSAFAEGLDGGFQAEWGAGPVQSRTVLLATGVKNRRPLIDEALHDEALDQGRIIESGPPEQVLSAPSHERTRAFLSKIL